MTASKAVRVPEFDTWRIGYGGAMVSVYQAGTKTLAALWLDEDMTTAADNPQVLDRLTIGDFVYGKFGQPVYCAVPFQLSPKSTDRTGIVRPQLEDLAGLDASQAEVTIENYNVARALRVWAADIVFAEWYGVIDDSDSAVNTTTIAEAASVVSNRSGGRVLLPPGTIPHTQITLAENVVLEGFDREATILQSELGAASYVLNGDRCGFRRLTLDGVSLTANSVGVYSVGNDYTIFDDVLIKRFETAMHFKGGRWGRWKNLAISDVAYGLKGYGDDDSGSTAGGTAFAYNEWDGGGIELATNKALDLSYEDLPVHHNSFRNLLMDANATAIRINGARWTKFEQCIIGGVTANITNLEVQDDSATEFSDNTVVGLDLLLCFVDGGAVTYTHNCESIRWERCEINDVDFTYTLPDHNILYLDCTEDSDVTLAGESIRHTRWRSQVHGGSNGVTTDDTETEAWSQQLVPGELGYWEVVAVARQREPDEGHFCFHIAAGCYRPGSTLDFDNQTADFTEGETLTGGTSGATAIIQKMVDAGATGTLTLIEITGEFEDGETITDSGGGSAQADGVLSHQDTTLDVQANRYVTAFPPTTLNARFQANEDKIEFHVTGNASETWDWDVKAIEKAST